MTNTARGQDTVGGLKYISESTNVVGVLREEVENSHQQAMAKDGWSRVVAWVQGCGGHNRGGPVQGLRSLPKPQRPREFRKGWTSQGDQIKRCRFGSIPSGRRVVRSRVPRLWTSEVWYDEALQNDRH